MADQELEKIVELTIPSFGKVVRITGLPFPDKLQVLRAEYERKYPLGLKVAAKMLMSVSTSEELVELYQQGFLTSETMIYMPEGPILITKAKQSPILNIVSAKIAARNQSEWRATQAKWDEHYYCRGEYELIKAYAKVQSNKPPEKRDVFTIDDPKDYDGIEVPTDNFIQDDLMKFLFGGNAYMFGKWLRGKGISNFEVRLVPREEVDDLIHQGRPFLRQLGLGFSEKTGDYAVIANSNVLDQPLIPLYGLIELC